MSFSNLLKKNDIEPIQSTQRPIEKSVNEEEKKPDEVLRGNGIKIKMITPTSFGTQIDLAKSYDEEEIKELLKDFTIKIKGKSIFIVD